MMIPGIVAGQQSRSSAVTTFAAAITDDAPYMWWRMGETAGTTLSDSSGNSRTAAMAGTAGTSYQLNQASLVNDSDPSIKLLADTGYIRSTSAFTFPLTSFSQVIAFKADSGAGAGVLTMMNQNTTPDLAAGSRDRGFILGSDGKLYYSYWNGSATVNLASLSALNDGNRHIAHLVVGSATTKLFIDGVLQASVSSVPAASYSAYLYVGRTNKTDLSSPVNTNGGFRGVVDEMVYFNKALSDSRVLIQAKASGLA